MRRPLRLGFLDFGESQGAVSVAEELRRTISYAQCIEESGFARLWFGEHHTRNNLWAAPHSIISTVGEHTSRIRLGAAGVLVLANHPLEVASTYKYLASRTAGRIDLGFAKGLPTLAENRRFLCGPEGSFDMTERYEGRVRFMVDALTRRGGSPAILPDTDAAPAMWILGTSGSGVDLAEQLNVGYIHSLFFRGSSDNFRRGSRPTIVAVAGICAATEDLASQLAAKYRDHFLRVTIVGTPETCAASLSEIGDRYEVDELIFLDCGPREDREWTVRALQHVLSSDFECAPI